DEIGWNDGGGARDSADARATDVVASDYGEGYRSSEEKPDVVAGEEAQLSTTQQPSSSPHLDAASAAGWDARVTNTVESDYGEGYRSEEEKPDVRLLVEEVMSLGGGADASGAAGWDVHATSEDLFTIDTACRQVVSDLVSMVTADEDAGCRGNDIAKFRSTRVIVQDMAGVLYRKSKDVTSWKVGGAGIACALAPVVRGGGRGNFARAPVTHCN
ncbi:PREDICTED: uncharacterized protein LOC106816209, partial [Priapulus caudatus]|uniref:Uncharacterized protein LOC106816209 n=1 Tax=Priapulus caudatus TaxID=37621 RepID=A0ABM1EVP0_PRICU